MDTINYQNDVLERFIPIDLDTLITDLGASDLLPEEQQLQFHALADAYIALYHAQTHKKLIALKRAYLPFNPDRDTVLTESFEANDLLGNFKNDLFDMIENANYEKLSEQDLNDSLNKISPHGVKVSVDFDEFENVFLYYRGSASKTELHWNWKRFSLKKYPVKINIYRRLFVVLQPRTVQQSIDYFMTHKNMSRKNAEKKADSIFKKLGISGEDQVLYLKLFKDIPRPDLEMLFPNTRVQIRLFDKLKLGVTGGGGTAGGVMATVTKFSAAIDPVSAVIAIVGLLGVLWRQIAKIFSQRAKYSAILTKNLYFYCLNNNMGALTYLVDTAESEECKEALLAYFFLLKLGTCNRDELDKTIEDFIRKKYGIPMDFEITDGLSKLHKARLMNQQDDVISAIPLNEAIATIKDQWADVFN